MSNSLYSRQKLDKGDIPFWDMWWIGEKSVAKRIPRPRETSFRGRHKKFFDEVFSGTDTTKQKLLEAGCGGSKWLVMFARAFGFSVSGIDYSARGCEEARAKLAQGGVAGNVIQADFFNPPDEIRNLFDVVFSEGVVEHYSDTAACIHALSELVKPGGLLITSIPNMCGLNGLILKRLNKPFFDIHVALDATELARAHESAGLEVLCIDYFMSTNFGVLTVHGTPPSFGRWCKAIAIKGLMLVSYIVWVIESITGPFRSNRITSPYINCVARKRGKPPTPDAY